MPSHFRSVGRDSELAVRERFAGVVIKKQSFKLADCSAKRLNWQMVRLLDFERRVIDQYKSIS